MRNQKRTREQRKADASARIAAVCLFLAVLLDEWIAERGVEA